MITYIEKEIVNNLVNDLEYDAPKIEQEQFDNIIDYIIKNEFKNSNELVWRLCINYEYLNQNKAIDLFIETKDSFHIAELVSIECENIDQEYLTNKMIETNDVNFIEDSLYECGNAMEYSLTPNQFEKLKDFCKENK